MAEGHSGRADRARRTGRRRHRPDPPHLQQGLCRTGERAPGFPGRRSAFRWPRSTLTYKLSIVGQRPVGITAYQATGRIEPLSEGRSRLNYTGEFTTESGKPEEAEAFLRMAYDLMFQGLTAATAAK